MYRERERHGERETEPRNLFLIFLFDGPHESWPRFPFFVGNHNDFDT